RRVGGRRELDQDARDRGVGGGIMKPPVDAGDVGGEREGRKQRQEEGEGASSKRHRRNPWSQGERPTIPVSTATSGSRWRRMLATRSRKLSGVGKIPIRIPTNASGAKPERAPRRPTALQRPLG